MTTIIFMAIIVLLALLFWDDSGGAKDPFPEIQQLISVESYVEANEKIAEIQKTNPDDIRSAYFLGEISEKQNNLQAAVEQYSAVLESGYFHPMIERKALYQKIPEIYQKLEQPENEFRSLMTMLKIFPKDHYGNERAALLTFGSELFQESLIFFERLQPSAPVECKRAHIAALGEAGKIEPAIKKAIAFLEGDKEDPIFNILHVALHQQKDPKKGREMAEIMIKALKEEHKMLQLCRIYLHMSIQLGILGPTVSFLQNQVTREDISDEGRAELLYAMTILTLKSEEYNLAEQLHSTLRSIKPNYRRSEELKLFIDARFINEQNDKVTPFATIMQELTDNLLPKHLFFRITGIRNQQETGAKNFFVKEDGKVLIASDFRPLSEEELLETYINMSAEEFLPFAETSLAILGYKLRKSIESEKAAMEYIAESKTKPPQKVLASFFRFKQGAQLSDVFVNNFLSDVKNQSCEKGLLVLNADLTDAGLSAAQQAANLRIVEKDRIYELMQSFLFANQKEDQA